VAAEEGKQDVLQKTCEWAKGNLTTEEIKIHLLLDTEKRESTFWHEAPNKGRLDILQKIW